MQKEDDFELSLFPPQEEPEAAEASAPAPREKPPLFDWQQEDPEDFQGDAPAQPEPEPFEQPLFVQDTFHRGSEQPAPVPAAPAPVQQQAAAPVPAPVPVPQPVPAPAPAPAPVPAAAPVPAPAPAPQPAAAPQGRVSNGHTVLISGGDRGIGAAAARRFWAAGYHTALLYNKNEDAARALINELGSDCVAVRCDVGSRAACEAAWKVVVRTFGDPDVLVCNAGIAQQKLFTEITEEEWQRMLDVDLSGAFHLCQLALPAMIRRKYGRILTVSSMWGQTGGSCEVHYSAAKAGLIGLTKALAKEEGPSGITVNCVAPGVVDTDMMSTFRPEDKQALAEETPVGRLGSADEIARTLLFLAAEEAGYITGQVFGVNGGLVI
jgi:3-oxoacyl-[acyl-carrier protein] reductase